MAEERIYAYYYKKHPCDGCDAKEVYDGCSCPVLEEYEMSITRQEAIERMAKAMCSSDGESCKQCAVKNNKHACKSVLHDELFMQYAEDALNALFGGLNEQKSTGICEKVVARGNGAL